MIPAANRPLPLTHNRFRAEEADASEVRVGARSVQNLDVV